MAHRVNFNVYRYGKTIGWNFNTPGTNFLWAFRANYIMQHWVKRVLKSKNIRVVRVYSNLGGEFPSIKIIGYREVYLRHRLYNQTGHHGYWGVLKSKKTPGAEDLLPIPANRVKTRLSFPLYRRKKWRNTQLRGNWRGRSPSLARAAYFPGIFPILRNSTHPTEDSTSQLRRLMYFESLFDEKLSNTSTEAESNYQQDDEDGASNALVIRGSVPKSPSFDSFCVQQVSNWNFDLDYMFNLLACQKMISRRRFRRGQRTKLYDERIAQKNAIKRHFFEQMAFLSIVKDKVLGTQSRGPFNFVASHLWAIKFIKEIIHFDSSVLKIDTHVLKPNFDFALNQLIQLKLGFAIILLFKKYSRLQLFIRYAENLKRANSARGGDLNPFLSSRLFLIYLVGLLESVRPSFLLNKGTDVNVGINEIRLLMHLLRVISKRFTLVKRAKSPKLAFFYFITSEIFKILRIDEAIFNPFFYMAKVRINGSNQFFWPLTVISSKDELETERASFAKFYARIVTKYNGLNEFMLNDYSPIIKAVGAEVAPTVEDSNNLRARAWSFMVEAASFMRWSTKKNANLFFIREANEKGRIFNLQSFKGLCADYLKSSSDLNDEFFLAPDENDTSLNYWRGAMIPRAYIKPLPFAHDVADTMSLSMPQAPKRETYTGIYQDEVTGINVFFTAREIRIARKKWKKVVKSLETNIKVMGLAVRAQAPDLIKRIDSKFAKNSKLAETGLIVNGNYFSKFTALNLSLAMWKAIKSVVFGGKDFDKNGRFIGSYTRGLFSEPRRILELNSTITRLWGMVVEKNSSNQSILKSKKKNIIYYNNPHLVGRALWVRKYPFCEREVTVKFDFNNLKEVLFLFYAKHVYNFFTVYSPYNTVLTQFESFDSYKEIRRGALPYPDLSAEKNNIVMLPTRHLEDYAVDKKLMNRGKESVSKTFFSSVALYLFAPKIGKYTLLFQVANAARLLGNAVAYYYIEAPVERAHFKVFTRLTPDCEDEFDATWAQIFIMASLSFAETSYYTYLESGMHARATEFYKKLKQCPDLLKNIQRASSVDTEARIAQLLFDSKKSIRVEKNIVLFTMSSSAAAVKWSGFLDALHYNPDRRKLAIDLDDCSDEYKSTIELSQNPLKNYSRNNLNDAQLEGGYWHNYSAAGDLVDLNHPHEKNSKGMYRIEFYETRAFLLNLSSAFYNVFGIYYNIFYYPVTKVFESHPRMRELASNSVHFLSHYVTRRPKEFSWLSEFLIIYYICVYLRITEPLVYFMTKVFTWEFRWSGPLALMWTVMKSVDLREFGISSIRVGFHGKYSGKERAFRLYRILGANPCLRNAHLTGSYSFKQIKSKYGTSHLHIWMTFV